MSKEAIEQLDALIQKYSDKIYDGLGPHVAHKFEEDCYHIKQALEQPQPVAWADLLKDAQQIVESKVLWKRFIDGTPLSNDIACWMADFAQQYTTPLTQQSCSQRKTLTDEQCDAITEALDNWASGYCTYEFFGLPHDSPEYKEQAREVIRDALLALEKVDKNLFVSCEK